MTTLYDVLGALPNDNSDELRAAFRKAVKSAHPDLHPGDPHAAKKFRAILRANDILVDVDQRAAYDHLLALAEQEHELARKQSTRHDVAAKLHRFASVVMVAAGVSIIAIVFCLLFVQIPADPAAHTISIAQSLSRLRTDRTAPSTLSVPPVTIAPLPPLSMKAAAVKPEPRPAAETEIVSSIPATGVSPAEPETTASLAGAAIPPVVDRQALPLAKAEDRPWDATTKKPQLRPLRADQLRLTRMSQRQSISD